MAKPGPIEVIKKTFIVLFSRASTRKHKTWEFDGRLLYRHEEYYNGGVSLLTLMKELSSGKRSEVFKNKGNHIKRIVEGFEPGHEFVMSNWDIQIQEEEGQSELASSSESAVSANDTKTASNDRFGFSRPNLQTNSKEKDEQNFTGRIDRSRLKDEAALRKLPIFNKSTELPVDLCSGTRRYPWEEVENSSQGSQNSQPQAKKPRAENTINSNKDVHSKSSQNSTSSGNGHFSHSNEVEDEKYGEYDDGKESVEDEDYYPATPEN